MTGSHFYIKRPFVDRPVATVAHDVENTEHPFPFGRHVQELPDQEAIHRSISSTEGAMNENGDVAVRDIDCVGYKGVESAI